MVPVIPGITGRAGVTAPVEEPLVAVLLIVDIVEQALANDGTFALFCEAVHFYVVDVTEHIFCDFDQVLNSSQGRICLAVMNDEF